MLDDLHFLYYKKRIKLVRKIIIYKQKSKITLILCWLITDAFSEKRNSFFNTNSEKRDAFVRKLIPLKTPK